jgi:hypothetical protein
MKQMIYNARAFCSLPIAIQDRFGAILKDFGCLSHHLVQYVSVRTLSLNRGPSIPRRLQREGGTKVVLVAAE